MAGRDLRRASATAGARTRSSVSSWPCRRSPGDPFELALASYTPQDRELLESRGWRVRDALDFTTDLDAYRDYVRGSRAEFTVAKDQNVRLRTGWFSDRAPPTSLPVGRSSRRTPASGPSYRPGRRCSPSSPSMTLWPQSRRSRPTTRRREAQHSSWRAVTSTPTSSSDSCSKPSACPSLAGAGRPGRSGDGRSSAGLEEADHVGRPHRRGGSLSTDPGDRWRSSRAAPSRRIGRGGRARAASSSHASVSKACWSTRRTSISSSSSSTTPRTTGRAST